MIARISVAALFLATAAACGTEEKERRKGTRIRAEPSPSPTASSSMGVTGESKRDELRRAVRISVPTVLKILGESESAIPAASALPAERKCALPSGAVLPLADGAVPMDRDGHVFVRLARGGATSGIPCSADAGWLFLGHVDAASLGMRREENGAPSGPAAAEDFDPVLGAQLARLAERGTRGNVTPKGKCWKYVDDAIEGYMRANGKGDATAVGVRWPTMAAYEFARSAEAQLANVRKRMLLCSAKRYVGKPASMAPAGAVLIFLPRKCGFHATYGHVEVALGGGRYASDFIASKRACAPDHVFLPCR